MKKLSIIISIFALSSCGMSQADKKDIAILTCNIVGASRNMDAVMRIKEINTAREKIGEVVFLGKDDAIKESFEYGLCKELVLNDPDYKLILDSLIQEKALMIQEEAPMIQEAESNLQQSEIFLLSNSAKDGVISLEDGLQYAVIDSGDVNESSPELSDTITAHFHGTLMDGSVFWSSVEMGDPLTIQLSQLISGCQKVISKMRAGDLWRVFIHPSLAYGEEGRPTIPPNSTLIFDIELISVDR